MRVRLCIRPNAFGNALGSSLASTGSRSSVSPDDNKLAAYGAGLSRASSADGTAALDGSIPLEIDIKGSRSLRYVDGSSPYLSQGELADGRLVFNHTNGYFVQDKDSYTGTFVAADMSNIGATLNETDYGVATRRLQTLNTKYDSPDIWHDISAAFDGWFGHEANPVRPANLELERTELRGIIGSYWGSHPELMAATVTGVDAAAGGWAGTVAVLSTINRSQEDRDHAYRLAGSVDQGFQAYGSMRAAVQNSPVLPPQGRPRLEPVGRSIIIRSTGRASGLAIPGSYVQQTVAPSTVNFSINTVQAARSATEVAALNPSTRFYVSSDGQTLDARTFARNSGFRANVRDEVWANAVDKATGLVTDPLTGRVMSQSEPWDMGHRPGMEFWKERDNAINNWLNTGDFMTRKQFLDRMNDPSRYRPELPSSNRGHRGEDDSNLFWQ